MKFLIFASFLVFASARSTVHLLGDEECTMGPSYWCKNIQTAKQCGAVKYCTQTYWPKHPKSTTCDTCKEVVGMVHSFLANNLTETEVIQGLNAACSMLGSYAAECKSLVNTYGKEILSLVTQYTANPTMICQMVEMCSKAGRSVEIETPAKMQKIMPIVFAMKKHFELKQSALCTVCEFGMSELDSLISKESTEKEITAYVEKLCNYLPSTVKTECDALISEYGKQIIALLVKQLSPKKICTELKLCSASIVKMIKLRKSSVKSGVTCELCELVVGEVEKLISTSTESEIVAELEKLCGYLGSYKAECDSIVKTYVPSIIELLKKELTPALVCKELGLCTALKKLLHNAIEGMKSGEFCPICKMGVTYVDNLLKNNSTETEITAELEQICSVMGSYQTMCKQYMSTYLPLVFKFLAQELSPDLVCKELGLCTAAKPLLVKVVKKIETVKADGVECTVCEFVVNYAEGLISTKTEDEIVKEVEKYCADLGSYKTECDAMVKMYLPKIIEMLKQEITPAVICKTLGLCSSTKTSLSNQTKKVLKSTSCDVCEMVVGYVEGLISTKTEAEITAEVDKLCSYLWSYKAECDALVKGYLPKIIDLLKKELSPKLVCSEVGLCPALKKLLSRVNLKAVRGGEYCTICKLLVGYVDTMLKDSKEQTEITAELEKFCSYFGTYETKCKSYVSAYVPLVIKYLAAEMTPELVCKELSLCTSVKNSKKQDVKFLLRV